MGKSQADAPLAVPLTQLGHFLFHAIPPSHRLPPKRAPHVRRSPWRRRRERRLFIRHHAPRVPLAVPVASSFARPPSIRGARGAPRSRTSCKHALDRRGEPLHLSDGSLTRQPGNIASGSPPVCARATVRGHRLEVLPVDASEWAVSPRAVSPLPRIPRRPPWHWIGAAVTVPL